MTGCQLNAKETKEQIPSDKDHVFEELKQVAEEYREIYEQALGEEKTQTLELKQEIIDCLGEKGYIVSDNENLINMQNTEDIENFIEKAKKSEEDDVTFYLVMENGGLVRYDLESKDGELDAVRSSLLWNDGEMKLGVYEEFAVQRWDYTEKGYLFLEQYHPEGYDGPPGQIGIRVKPLKADLRELNRKYIVPIGFGCNNLLITNWNEKNFATLDFYDLYEILYRMEYGVPAADNGGVEALEFQIPAEEFEKVIQAYIDVNEDGLRALTVFNEETMTYRYRPRTMDDMEMPYGPEPEVTACEVMTDGCLKLTVEAVWIREFMDCASVSELVVRPMSDGTFRYVSNKVISSEAGVKFAWRKERLTEEEWESLYEE